MCYLHFSSDNIFHKTNRVTIFNLFRCVMGIASTLKKYVKHIIPIIKQTVIYFQKHYSLSWVLHSMKVCDASFRCMIVIASTLKK